MSPYQQRLAHIYTLLSHYQFSEARQALNELIIDNGANFSTALLRYRLTRLDSDKQSEAYLHDECALYQLNDLNDLQLGQLANIWCNSDIQDKIPFPIQLHLAMQLTTLSDFREAAVIFHRLRANDVDKIQLGLLARKLSMAYQRIRENDKQQQYATIADELLSQI